MRGRTATFVLALLTSACASIGGADRQPPPLNAAMAELNAESGCADIPGPLNPNMASERCQAVYPRDLERIGVTANCRSMFDLSEDGRPQNIQSRCAVAGQPAGAFADEWTAFAEALFAASVDRSFEVYRVEPDELGPGGPTTGLSALTYFRSRRNAAPELVPEPFVRDAAQ